MAKTITSANLGFEDKLWAAADKLRGNMDAAEYKHVVLGLIFRFTPTCVGTITPQQGPIRSLAVHPHVRGDD